MLMVVGATGLASIVVSAAMVAGWPAPGEAVRWLVVGPFAFWAAGAFLAWKRPNHPVSHLMLAIGTVFSVQTVLEVALKDRGTGSPSAWLLTVGYMISMVAILVLTTRLIGLFPDGVYRSSGERRIMRGALWLVALPIFVALTTPELDISGIVFGGTGIVAFPTALAAAAGLSGVAVAAYQLIQVVPVAGIVLLVRRYRGFPEQQKLQVRWVLYAVIAALVLGSGPFLLSSLGLGPGLHGTLLADLGSLPILLFPASVVVSVMEARLFDIDRFARKSVVFGAIWLMILITYLIVAAATGVALGERVPIEVAVLVTAVVAIALQPARRRLERLAERWVFGHRPTDYEVVADFGATVRYAGDATELAQRLIAGMRQALSLSWCRVTMDDGTVFSVGEVDGRPAHRVPLSHAGSILGTLDCGRRVDGRLDAHDREVIGTLVDHAALAIHSRRLASRIVHAQEEERRRLERDIHDGAQQELVALMAGLGLAKAKAAGGRLGADDIEALQREAGRILAGLRELSQGIHPAVLTDGGLVEAIGARCERIPLESSLTATPSLRRRRFSDDVEGAVYFFVCEGLANVLKHAQASRVDIDLELTDRLYVSVKDDGVGIDDQALTSGSGIAGLHDRITALGGTMQVTRRISGGTRLSASLPVGAPR